MNGIQRLSEMIKGQKDKSLIKIVSYLMLQTDMDQDFLKEEKELKEMAEYINGLAKKEATNGVAIIEDETVYSWAKEYFIKSNKELGIKKYKLEKSKHGDVKKVEIKDEDDEFGSIFGNSVENEQAEKKEEIAQISLFAA
ncbi:MAG: hypothetical protein HFJ29_00935 [Clostridia bacterium]|nr:hypothetical protein [Clostridia bacterium]